MIDSWRKSAVKRVKALRTVCEAAAENIKLNSICAIINRAVIRPSVTTLQCSCTRVCECFGLEEKAIKHIPKLIYWDRVNLLPRTTHCPIENELSIRGRRIWSRHTQFTFQISHRTHFVIVRSKEKEKSIMNFNWRYLALIVFTGKLKFTFYFISPHFSLSFYS